MSASRTESVPVVALEIPCMSTQRRARHFDGNSVHFQLALIEDCRHRGIRSGIIRKGDLARTEGIDDFQFAVIRQGRGERIAV